MGYYYMKRRDKFTLSDIWHTIRIARAKSSFLRYLKLRCVRESSSEYLLLNPSSIKFSFKMLLHEQQIKQLIFNFQYL